MTIDEKVSIGLETVLAKLCEMEGQGRTVQGEQQ